MILKGVKTETRLWLLLTLLRDVWAHACRGRRRYVDDSEAIELTITGTTDYSLAAA
jgi:hypothetical protein